MEYKEIKYNDIPLTVYFTVSGRYYPATYDQPEEHPELEIQKVTVSDSEIDIYDLFREEDLETINDLLYESNYN